MDLDIKNKDIMEYFNVLSKDIPEFIYEYVNVPEMQRLKEISMISACEHTKLIPVKFFHTRYEHSIGVALIVWRFTHDKKQTIAGLYHDIATPAFSHVVDYLHGDIDKQESTEELTGKIIRNSKSIMSLLERDRIKVEEIEDYHLYPIADNDSPRLAADRLEYTISNGLVTQDAFDLQSIEKIFNKLLVLKNEDGNDEIGFADLESLEEYLERASIMWRLFSGNSENAIIMQFWTDILKAMADNNYITEKDLYIYSEREVVEKIKKCDNESIRKIFEKFSLTTKVGRSDIMLKDKYCIEVKSKKRYTNPLVLINGKTKRSLEASKKANKLISEIKEYCDSKYVYLDIDL